MIFCPMSTCYPRVVVCSGIRVLTNWPLDVYTQLRLWGLMIRSFKFALSDVLFPSCISSAFS